MSSSNQHPDPDDIFSDSRMSFGDHIEDLRRHLIRAVKWFLLALVVAFFIGRSVVIFIAAPVEEQLQAFYDRRAMKVKETKDEDESIRRINTRTDWTRMAFHTGQIDALLKGDYEKVNQVGKPPAGDGAEGQIVHLWMSIDNPVDYLFNLREAQYLFGKRPALTTLSVQEAFMVYFKVSLVTGFILGSPLIFYEVWSFIAVGLYPHEKRLVNVYLPVSIGLFIGGVLLCQFFVIPRAIEALLWFNEWMGLEPDLRMGEWLGFAILMPLVFGISFQTPIVMLFLNRLGIMDVASFRRKRRVVLFILAVFAATFTPSPDPTSMLFLWLPMCLLFEFGIWLCLMAPQPTPFDEDVPDSDEVIEV